jgi:hypothetical protein
MNAELSQFDSANLAQLSRFDSGSDVGMVKISGYLRAKAKSFITPCGSP